MQGLEDGHVEQFGAALAMEWTRLRISLTKAGKEEVKEETGIEDLFADCGIAKPSAQELEHVRWDDEMVQGLLVPVEKEVDPLEEQYNDEAFWMDIGTAKRMFKGEWNSAVATETPGDNMEE